MGLLGAIAGGALQGLGQGIVTDAVARRNEALASMKEQAEAARQQAGFNQQNQLEGVKHTNRLDEIDAEGDTRVAALEAGGKITQETDAKRHTYKLGEISYENVGRAELARLGSRLKMSETAAELQLRDKLEAGDFKTVVRGEDGTYLGVTDKGLVPTGIKADPTSADKNSNGGGVLTDTDKSSALDDATKAWRDGGRKGERPKASDFIGMTAAEYRQKYGGGAGGPATGPTAGTPGASPRQGTGKPISASDRTALYTQALTKGRDTPDRVGDPRFRGKTPSQVKAIIDDGLRIKGYDL